jgi:replication-associated recombination protein RarA
VIMATYMKYSPKTFDEIVLSPSIKKWLLDMKACDQMENMLFYGQPGIGKSLVASLLGTNVMMIHCDGDVPASECLELAYDAARHVNLMDDTRRIIVLDEIDRWDRRFQEKVRALITSTGDCATFIATTNHLDKVIDGLQSRLMPICFDVDPANLSIRLQWQKRLVKIFEMETGKKPSKESITQALRYFPDGRRMTTSVLMPAFG